MKIVILLAALMMAGTVKSQEWHKDLNKALKEAAASNKKVLLYFSVPEACDECIMLEKNIWKSEEFNEFAKNRYVLAKADFSQAVSMEDRAENLLIVEKYNKDGFFPLVVILSKDGRVLGKNGNYNNETPQAYISLLESLEKM